MHVSAHHGLPEQSEKKTNKPTNRDESSVGGGKKKAGATSRNFVAFREYHVFSVENPHCYIIVL